MSALSGPAVPCATSRGCSTDIAAASVFCHFLPGTLLISSCTAELACCKATERQCSRQSLYHTCQAIMDRVEASAASDNAIDAAASFWPVTSWACRFLPLLTSPLQTLLQDSRATAEPSRPLSRASVLAWFRSRPSGTQQRRALWRLQNRPLRRQCRPQKGRQPARTGHGALRLELSLTP